MRYDADLAQPLVVDWVVLDRDTRADREGGRDWVPGVEQWFLDQGFGVERSVGSFVVMHRRGEAP